MCNTHCCGSQIRLTNILVVILFISFTRSQEQVKPVKIQNEQILNTNTYSQIINHRHAHPHPFHTHTHIQTNDNDNINT